MALGSDLTGGINKISESALAHDTDDDNKALKKLFEGYSSVKRSPNGLFGQTPDGGDRILTKTNAQLASEDAIKNWNELSEGALEKFMNNFFDKTFSRYDNFNR